MINFIQKKRKERKHAEFNLILISIMQHIVIYVNKNLNHLMKKIQKRIKLIKKKYVIITTLQENTEEWLIVYVIFFCKQPIIWYRDMIFHNLQGYDSHLFINEIGKIEDKFDCIPSTEEKYLSFSKKITVDHYTDKKNEKKKNQ